MTGEKGVNQFNLISGAKDTRTTFHNRSNILQLSPERSTNSATKSKSKATIQIFYTIRVESCVQCKSICKNNDYLLDLALTLIWKNNIQCNVLHVLPNSNIEEEICEFPSFLGFLIL